MRKIIAPLMSFVVVLLVWDLVVRWEIVQHFLLPSPLEVWQALLELRPELSTAALSTFSSTLIGFFWSAILGFLVALLFSASSTLKQAILPFAVFFQTVPIVAIAPLLVIWFGFGAPTVRASAFIVSFFPILANALTGLSQTDPQLLELFQIYRASRWQKIFYLQIPASLSYVVAGLKISSGLAIIGAIVGEFVAGGGLGGMIDSARTQQRVDVVFAALILSSFLGILFVSLMQILTKGLLRWRPFFTPH